jgi:uncharacterized repeat protein (TIGR03803 family)
MYCSRLSFLLAACAAFASTLAVTAVPAAAQTETALYTFGSNGTTDGSNPYSGLTFDSAGNLYGATDDGGVYGPGAVFELSPAAGGGWTEKVLHSFHGSPHDGENPSGAGLILDASGNLYGTTAYGGQGTCNCGTVYELSPAAGGGWTEKLLHSFTTTGEDGQIPLAAGLVLDAAGNLYGTTQNGGVATCEEYNNVQTCGTVFELSPTAEGRWMEKILHRFNNNGRDGYYPTSRLVFDTAGNLYGTTGAGGMWGAGTVFELKPTSTGAWDEAVLHDFGNGQTGSPYAGVILDASGNLYGATYEGGTHQDGTIFELTPAAGGHWTETLLYSFVGGTADACQPFGGVIFDTAGNLYGAGYQCGATNSGAVFELSPVAGGGWSEEVLYDFSRDANGWQPFGGVILDSSGNLYGTTVEGGINNNGTVYEITP